MTQTRVAKLTTTGDLKVAGGLNERQPAVLSSLVAHFPLDGTVTKYIPGQIRYIRDWLNGNTINTSNHWVEIKVLDYANNNIALNKTVTANFTPSSSHLALSGLVDGDTNTLNYIDGGTGNLYTQIDLGNLFNISKIIVWHYYSDGRTYHATKTEVSDDGIHWYSIFDSVIEGEYAETSAGHTIDFRNLGLTCNPSTNTGNTLNFDGISVEETTTNLISDKKNIYFLSGHSWDKRTFDSITIMNLYNFLTNSIGVARFKRATASNSFASFSINLSSPSAVHTVSMYVSMISGNINNVNDGGTLCYTDSTVTDYTWTSSGRTIVKIDDNLYKIIYTFTPPSNGKTLSRYEVRISYMASEACDFLVYGIQVEQKPFETSITTGTRAEGDFKIKGILPPSKGTILVEVTFHEDDTINNLQGSDQYCFGNTIAYNLANHMIFHDTKTWRIRDNANNAYNITMNSPMIREERTKLAFVYDDTDGTMDIYKNGVLVTSGAKQTGFIGKLGSLGADWTHSGHALTTQFKMCQTVHSLTFYNVPLTAKQIAMAHGEKLMPNKSGDMFAPKITQRAIGVPNDGFYFPLTFDGKNEFKTITPVSETAIIYSEEGAWIGQNNANIAVDTSSYWNNTSSVATYTANDTSISRLIPNNAISSMLITTNGQSGIKVGTMSSTAGTIYSGHIYVWVDCPTETSGIIFYLREENTAGTVKSLTVLKYNGKILSGSDFTTLPQKRWIKLTFDNITTSSDTANIAFCAYLQTAGNKIYFTAPKITNTVYDIPEDYLGNDPSGTSLLRYNFNRDLGIDWNGNWSICYWKKALGTHTNDLTGWNIESLGANGNSVGGGYIYWGKNNAANGIYNTSATFTASKYFGKWYMVSLIKSGSTLTIKHWFPGDNLTVVTETRSLGIIASNYFVNQYGYDFMLGGFYSGRDFACSTYHRDLVVVPNRALTDAELTALATIYAKAGSKTRLQGKLTDGYVNY